MNPALTDMDESDVEASRVFRRLLFMRRSYDEQNAQQVFA
jgi:hypothetical protein